MFCQPARVAQRIIESGTEAICVGFMSPDARLFSIFLNLLLFLLFLNLWHFFCKMNDLKCLLKLPAELVSKCFCSLTIFHMLHTGFWFVENVGYESYLSSSKTIRAFYGREVRIENSIMTVIPIDGILNSHPITIIDSFSCILFFVDGNKQCGILSIWR